MQSAKTPLIIVIAYLLVAFAASDAASWLVPSPNRNVSDGLDTNVSSLGAPVPPEPEHFEAKLQFNKEQPLSPLGVYVNAIAGMHFLSQLSWSARFRVSWVIREPQYNVLISFSDKPIHIPPIQTKHLVLTLYKAILAMAEQRPGFFLVDASIWLLDVDAGLMRIKFVGDREAELPTQTFTESSNTANSSISTDYHQGTIVDPADDKFVIEWEAERRTSLSRRSSSRCLTDWQPSLSTMNKTHVARFTESVYRAVR